VRLRDSWESLLRHAGQPQERTRVWTWCATGERNGSAADVAELSKSGKVELAGSNGRGRGALGIEVASKASRLRGVASSLGNGLFVKGAGHGGVYVWLVAGGRVKAVGVATKALASHGGDLAGAMNRLAGAHASQAKRVFLPNRNAVAAEVKGATLATRSSDPRLNRALALLCGFH
jgi:hypothetical protein